MRITPTETVIGLPFILTLLLINANRAGRGRCFMLSRVGSRSPKGIRRDIFSNGCMVAAGHMLGLVALGEGIDC